MSEENVPSVVYKEVWNIPSLDAWKAKSRLFFFYTYNFLKIFLNSKKFQSLPTDKQIEKKLLDSYVGREVILKRTNYQENSEERNIQRAEDMDSIT